MKPRDGVGCLHCTLFVEKERHISRQVPCVKMALTNHSVPSRKYTKNVFLGKVQKYNELSLIGRDVQR